MCSTECYCQAIFSPQISCAVCTGTGTARSPVVQNSSLKRLPTISADDTSSFMTQMVLIRREVGSSCDQNVQYDDDDDRSNGVQQRRELLNRR